MAGSKHILFAMKQQGACHAAQKMLQNAGFNVIYAGTLRTALSQASSTSVGLIVCGLELDDVSGTALLTFLKNDPTREHIPFVFLTNKKNQAALNPEIAMNLGAKDCIFYPISEKEFISRIRATLAPPEPAAPQKRKPPATSVEVSVDKRNWTCAQVINHTRHGAMIETGLAGKTGDVICIKYPLHDGAVVATGKLIHILVGDSEQPMGLGINFGKDENWGKIHNALSSGNDQSGPADASSRPPKAAPKAAPVKPTPEEAIETQGDEAGVVDLTQQPFSPISIEVSRDGNLWMPAKIDRYSTRRASIKTPVLGKPGNDIFLKCVTNQGQKAAKAVIEKLSLDDLKMPAGLQVVFDESDAWLQITEFLDELIATLLREEIEEIATPAAPEEKAEPEPSREPAIASPPPAGPSGL